MGREMSYSRWANSWWYTYVASSNFCFVVDCDFVFTPEQMKDIDRCLKIVNSNNTNTTEQMEELRGYMKAYQRDFPTGRVSFD